MIRLNPNTTYVVVTNWETDGQRMPWIQNTAADDEDQ